MFFNSFLISLVVSIVLTAIFAWILGRRGPWSSIFAFFSILFLVTWAGGIWMLPLNAMTISWVPFIIIALVSSLVLSATVPSWYRRMGTEPALQPERRKPPVAYLSPYYWLAITVLVITIVVR